MRILADPYERETGVAKLALLRVLCFHVFLDIDALARFCLEREGYSVVLRETLNLAVHSDRHQHRRLRDIARLTT